jgi:hypothetical protein
LERFILQVGVVLIEMEHQMLRFIEALKPVVAVVAEAKAKITSKESLDISAKR